MLIVNDTAGSADKLHTHVPCVLSSLPHTPLVIFCKQQCSVVQDQHLLVRRASCITNEVGLPVGVVKVTCPARKMVHSSTAVTAVTGTAG